MANQFVNLPVPAGNGVGAAVDMSSFGASKSIVVGGDAQAQITIEINNDAGQLGSWSAVKTFQNTGELVIDIACRWMRVRVSNYNSYAGGTPNVDVGGDDAGTSFATPVATAGNGTGASVNVSALGIFKTVQVGGAFRGMVIVEVSEDGNDWAQPFAFQSQSPNFKSLVITAEFMRVKRVGVPKVDPGLPVVNIGACEEGGGGGGGGGSGSSCLIYRPDSGETGPVVFDDFNELYTQLETLRGEANDDGCYTIMFDDTLVSPANVPPGDGGAYDMTNVTWEGMGGIDSHTEVNLLDGVEIVGLRRITNFLDLVAEGATSPIRDMGTNPPENDAFVIGLWSSIAGDVAAVIEIVGEQGGTIILEDGANLGANAVNVNQDVGPVSIALNGARSSIAQNAVASIAGSTVEFEIGSSSATTTETQPALLGTFNKENYTLLRLNPTPQPPEAPYTADDTAEPNDLVLVDPSVVDDPPILTITLPPAFDNRGKFVVVKNVTSSTNQIVIAPDGADTIDDAASLSMTTPYGSTTLVSDGESKWHVVDQTGMGSAFVVPEQWAQSNVAANQTDVVMSAQLSTNFDTYVATRPGSITAISWRIANGPVTQGSIDIVPTVNGNPVANISGQSTAVDNPTGAVVRQAAGLDTFTTGDVIGFEITTSADMLPDATMDIEVTLEITN